MIMIYERMKAFIVHHVTRLWVLCLALFLATTASSYATSTNEWFSLEGQCVATGNPISGDGLIRSLNAAVLQIARTPNATPKGTILLFPGGGYHLLDAVGEGSKTVTALNASGFDVALLQYHFGTEDNIRELALADALVAWRLIQQRGEEWGIHLNRLGMMGYSAGGHLAACIARKLAAISNYRQPDDLILVYPAYLDESLQGSAVPDVTPPDHPKSRLFALIAADDKPHWVAGCRAYVESWKALGGQATFHLLENGGHGFGMKEPLTGAAQDWPALLADFLEHGTASGVGPFNDIWADFNEHRDGRLAEFTKTKADDQGAIVFFGDSITEKWNLPKYFPHLKTSNRGIAGDTTRGILQRVRDNVLNLHPSAVVLLGGINDFFQKHPAGKPETIAANVRLILEAIKTNAPQTPVLICEIFPCRFIPEDKILAANAAVDGVVADFPNAHSVQTHALFLNADGTQNSSLFTDGTHLTPAGYAVWKTILEPELDKLPGLREMKTVADQ